MKHLQENKFTVVHLRTFPCLLAIFFLFVSNTAFPYWEDCFEGIYSEYREDPLELVQKFMPDRPIIFEAGGHYGHHTKKFAELWPHAKIISFEPNPHAYEIFLENTKDYPNVHAYNLAVNEITGPVNFYVCHGSNGNDPKYEGASSLLEPSDWMRHHYQGPVIQVQGVNLDEWSQKNKIDHIDFMWLDLEGMELQVLRSSPEILKRTKIIVTETNFLSFRKDTTQYQNLKQFLENSGFILLSHWYQKYHDDWFIQISHGTDGSFQGDAVFIQKEYFSKR